MGIRTFLAMKSLYFLPVFLLSASVSGQSIQITDTSVSAVDGGINVNVQTISFNGAGYLSHDYTITGSTIELSVCYYFNMTAPVLTFDNDFFIPVTEPGNYTVNVLVYNSASAVTCDYFSLGGTTTTTILSSDDFQADPQWGFFPNPADDNIRFNFPADKIRIFDMTGKLVLEQMPAQTVNTDGLQDGVYLIHVNAGTEILTKKLIKR